MEDILFQADDLKDCVMEDGTVALVSGIVFLSPQFVDKLISMVSIPPLDACTYVGLDSGAQPLSISLFFDVLRCMAAAVEKNEFIERLLCTKDKLLCFVLSVETSRIVIQAKQISMRGLNYVRITDVIGTKIIALVRDGRILRLFPL